MERTEKALPTLGVLGVLTGRMLNKFSEIHEVMDHFYPGIMIIGCATMADTAAKEVLRQHPELAELGECTKENYEQYANNALAKLGDTITLLGPHGSGGPDMLEPR